MLTFAGLSPIRLRTLWQPVIRVGTSSPCSEGEMILLRGCFALRPKLTVFLNA